MHKLSPVIDSPEKAMLEKDKTALIDLLTFANANAARFAVEAFVLKHSIEEMPRGLTAALERRYGPDFRTA